MARSIQQLQTASLLDHEMPASREAERLILGAILLDDSTLNQATARLQREDFFFDAHRRVFAGMLLLADAERGIDPITLADVLKSSGDLERVGGPAAISELFDGVPRFSNIEEYVGIVREKATLRQSIRLGQQLVQRAFDGEVAVDLLLAEAERAVVDLRQAGMPPTGLISQDEACDDLLVYLQERWANPGVLPGLATGFHDLDNVIGGLQPEDLVILAARPGEGKTTLGMNIKRNVTSRDPDRVVFVVSLEMSARRLLLRDAAAQTGIDYKRILRGQIDADEQRMVSIVIDRELRRQGVEYFDTTNETTVDQIALGCERVRRERGRLDLIIVDHLHLVDGAGESQNAVISKISRGLKRLTTRYKCPVLALAQLNREVEKRVDRRCRLSDLRDSGSIEQDASVVMFINRVNPDGPECEIDIAKNRDGETAAVPVLFFRERSLFTSAAR